MLLIYCLSDFEIVPVAPFITGITFVFAFHMRWISIVRSLYFRTLPSSFLITFLSPEIATSVNIHVPFLSSRIRKSCLLLAMVLSVCTRWFQICLFYYYYYYYYYASYHLYSAYLQLYTWNKPCFYGIQCCSCSVFTVCATCNVIPPMKYVL